MNLKISGRKAIVCASSRGLGKACAISLARNGVHVTLNGRDEKVLTATAEEIRVLSPDVCVDIVAGNVSDPECQLALVATTPDPDILINNNGGPPFRDFRDLERENMTEGVIMNMITPIEMIKQVIDGMAGRKFGRIVNIASIAGLRARPHSIAYAVSKAGMIALTKSLAEAIAADNIRVNAIAPGLIETDIIADVDEAAKQKLIDATPMLRLGQPEEIAEVAHFLLSEQSSFMTGQTIVASGGRVLLP